MESMRGVEVGRITPVRVTPHLGVGGGRVGLPSLVGILYLALQHSNTAPTRYSSVRRGFPKSQFTLREPN